MPKPLSEHVISQRRVNIREHLRTPSTVKELCNALSLNYYTVRRHLKELELQGLVKECTWRRGREVVYQITKINDNSQAVAVGFGNSTIPVSRIPFLVKKSPALQELGKLLAVVMHHFHDHMHLQSQGEKQTGYPNITRCKEAIEELARVASATADACNQLLDLPIWSEESGLKAVEIMNLISYQPELADDKDLSDWSGFYLPLFDTIFPERKKA